jgi:hypothetical protein
VPVKGFLENACLIDVYVKLKSLLYSDDKKQSKCICLAYTISKYGERMCSSPC